VAPASIVEKTQKELSPKLLKSVCTLTMTSSTPSSCIARAR
jgi:hypothetical protein